MGDGIGTAMMAGLFHAYFAYKDGNGDVAFVWAINVGLAGGALAAHLEIKEMKDGEE